MKYVCTVCGYVYEGESLPADYVCPVCKAPADKFLAQGDDKVWLELLTEKVIQK